MIQCRAIGASSCVHEVAHRRFPRPSLPSLYTSSCERAERVWRQSSFGASATTMTSHSALPTRWTAMLGTWAFGRVASRVGCHPSQAQLLVVIVVHPHTVRGRTNKKDFDLLCSLVMSQLAMQPKAWQFRENSILSFIFIFLGC